MRKLNEIATDMIPIRLIISITVIVAISILFSFGFFSFAVTVSENDVGSQINYLLSNTDTMIASGFARDIYEPDCSDGTKRSISFNLPDNIMYLSFGCDPDIDNNGILESNLMEEGNVIFYRVSNGNKKVFWLDSEVRFREGEIKDGKWLINSPDQGFIIRNRGKTTVVFELVERFNEKYVLIQSNDNID